MILKDYHMRDIRLTDTDNDVFVGKAYFCDKEDYETDEDGLEMRVDGEIVIFYQSDIQAIELI
ncbi:hypothetical protein ABPH35_02245 [Streptococcus sp. ZJ93]|uniref:hypothetical protein n=1 Tax=Streptococcus handemini TaxID=3161188 RepID=UPI0034D43357